MEFHICRGQTISITYKYWISNLPGTNVIFFLEKLILPNLTPSQVTNTKTSTNFLLTLEMQTIYVIAIGIHINFFSLHHFNRKQNHHFKKKNYIMEPKLSHYKHYYSIFTHLCTYILWITIIKFILIPNRIPECETIQGPLNIDNRQKRSNNRSANFQHHKNQRFFGKQLG